MLKTHLSFLVAVMLLLVAVPHQTIAKQTSTQAPTVETIKSKVARIGVGAKAKATIRLKNGTKVKGYIAQVQEDDFVIRDRKTDAPTTIRYVDVLKVEENRGHSTARNIGIGVAAGVGAVLAIIFITIAHLD